MNEGNRVVAEVGGTAARHMGMIGTRGLYPLVILGACAFGMTYALPHVGDALIKVTFVAFRVLYSWAGFPGAYRALTREVGAVAGLALFALPFAGLAWRTWRRRKGRSRTGTRLGLVGLACCASAWSAQVVPQTYVALLHPGDRPGDEDRCIRDVRTPPARPQVPGGGPSCQPRTPSR